VRASRFVDAAGALTSSAIDRVGAPPRMDRVAASRIRSTAEERRTELLAAALSEFAVGGLHGTSTEAIAKRAGISHAYLFRLFGTKKQLFIACAHLCRMRVGETFAAAAIGAAPTERLASMGQAYVEMLADRELLLSQMQLY